jgi:hypothetical protein
MPNLAPMEREKNTQGNIYKINKITTAKPYYQLKGESSSGSTGQKERAKCLSFATDARGGENLVPVTAVGHGTTYFTESVKVFRKFGFVQGPPSPFGKLINISSSLLVTTR